MNAAGAIDGFSGTIELEGNKLTLNGANTTAAKITGTNVIDANADQTLTAAGAIDGFSGTIELEGNKLTLDGANTTSATITGSNKIAANADQVFNGDVTGFTGEFVIAADKSVTLSGTFADADNSVVNASGATLNLADKSVAVTVNGGAGLDTLNFGNNSLTLGTGAFTNVNGTGSVVFADGHTDNAFASLVAGNVSLTGGRDITATEFDGNLYITINTEDNNIADLTTESIFGDTIYVTITDQSLLSGNDYKLITAGGYGVNTIQLWDATLGAYVTLTLNDGVKANGFTYTLRESADKTWILNQLSQFSNFVVINAAWGEKVPYQQVMDGTTDRSIGYDAASDLASAVEYIRGWNIGQGWDNGNLQLGDAKIELTAGKYALASGTLMTTENGVTQLTVAGREDEKAILNGVLRGSDGSAVTTLTIENVTIQATELYAGGNLVIKNGADDKSSGNVIAAGIGNTTANSEVIMANASSLVINGGYFNNRMLVGGSVANAAGAKVTVDGATSVVIDNNSSDTLTITGNIYGGSWAAKGEVVQNGDASILINADKDISIRGNIFVSGGASANGTLTMNGDSTITFSGDANKLTFTGTVSAIQSDNAEIVVFNDFHGATSYPLTIGSFNGSLSGFDTVVISGDSAISFGRRQTETYNTTLTFDIDGRFGASSKVAGVAMYTVRDANSWEFSTNIVIDSATNSYDGYDYVLVDNYAGDFSQFNFTVAGNVNYTMGEWVYDANGAAYKLYVDDANKLLLQYVKAANNVVVEEDNTDLAISNAKLISVADGVTAKTTDALNLEEVTLGEGAALEISSKNRNLSEVTLGNGSTLTLNSADSNTGTMDNLNMQVANAGATATVVWDEGGNWDYAAGYTVGEGVTLQTAKTVINGGNAVQIDGTLDSAYFYMLDGDVNVTGTLIGKGDAIQVKGGSQLNVEGGEIASQTSINVWQGDSALNVNNGTVNLSAGHIHLWDGAVKANFTNSNVGYGSDFIVGNAGNGAVMTVDNTVMNQSVASDTAVSAVNSGNSMIVQNGSVINLGAAGMKVQGTGLATDGAALEVYGSVINGNITGSDNVDAITIDVDAVLNGTISGIETLSITGVSSLTTDVAGAKAIAGSADSALANVKIDDVDSVLGTATKIAGIDTADVADDVWASLNQLDNGSLVVAWGRSETEVASALDAFKADNTLTIGESVVASATTLGDSNVDNDFSKKNNGTLA